MVRKDIFVDVNIVLKYDQITHRENNGQSCLVCADGLPMKRCDLTFNFATRGCVLDVFNWEEKDHSIRDKAERGK